METIGDSGEGSARTHRRLGWHGKTQARIQESKAHAWVLQRNVRKQYRY